MNNSHVMLIGIDIEATFLDQRSWILDITSGKWTAIEPMIQGRLMHGCLSISNNGGVLVFGGHDGYSLRWSVQQYHPETGSWSQEPDLPKDIIGEHALAPITLNRGHGVGLALFPDSKQIYQYNAEDKQWSVLEGAQLPKPLRGPDGMYGSDKAFLVPHDFVLSCI